MKSTELLERYVNEVGHHLPRKSRSDIQMELLSLLQDELEERTPPKQEPDLQTAAALLREFGRPQTMAGRYQADQYLVGPALLPYYKMIAKIVVAGVGGFHVLVLLLAFFRGGMAADPLGSLLQILGSFANSALIYLGGVTVVFVLLERFDVILTEKEAAGATPWDPLSLPPVDHPNRVKRLEMIAGIFWAVVFIVFLNSLGRWSIDDQTGLASLFTPEFLALIPLLSVSLGLEIITRVLVTWQGRWQTWTRLADIAQEIFGLYVLNLVIQTPILTVIEVANWGIKAVLWIIFAIVVIEVIGKIFRLVVGRPIIDLESIRRRPA